LNQETCAEADLKAIFWRQFGVASDMLENAWLACSSI
jgi:hypothetical protein